MAKYNSSDIPSGRDIRREGAVPHATQIPNDSGVDGLMVSDALDTNAASATTNAAGIATNVTDIGTNASDITALEALAAQSVRVRVQNLSVETLNDEQSVAIGGAAGNQFTPHRAVVQMIDVGAGAAANGDMEITIGTASGGTQILTATACTGLIGLNTRFIIDLSAVVKPAIGADSTIYVKVTTADTTAGAGHLADVYLIGDIVATAS